MVIACVGQVTIWTDKGGRTRGVVWGIVDIIFVTFLVHPFGSLSTILVSLYLLVGVMNALVVDSTVALSLAGGDAFVANSK